MPEPIVQPLSASLTSAGIVKRTFVFYIRARLRMFNTHMFAIGSFLRIARGPDQLVLFSPPTTLIQPAPKKETNAPDQLTLAPSSASLVQLAPDTFESSLPGQLLRFSFRSALIPPTPAMFKGDLPDEQLRLIKLRNQTALITYDLAHNIRTVSKSYYND